MNQRTLFIGLSALLLCVVPAFAVTDYSLEIATELLDSDFYSGAPGQFGAIEVPSGRWATLGTPNNAGTQVAFHGQNAATGHRSLFVVNIGDPSSWRQVDTTSLPLERIAWTPDDQYVAIGGRRIRISDGEGAQDKNYYRVLVGDVDDISQICQSPSIEFDWNTPGDFDGFDVAAALAITDVTVDEGSLRFNTSGTEPLLLGELASPFSAALGSHITLRVRFDNFSARDTIDDSFHVAWLTDNDGLLNAAKSVSFVVGEEGMWHRYVLDVGANPEWQDNITHLAIVAPPLNPGFVEIDYIRICGGTSVANSIGMPIRDDGIVAKPSIVRDNTVTRLAGLNIGAGKFRFQGKENIVVARLNPDGSIASGPGAFSAVITDFPAGTIIRYMNIAKDASSIAFSVRTPSTQPDFNLPGFESDLFELYLLQDVITIAQAPKDPLGVLSTLAPTSLADPRVLPLRIDGEPGKSRPTGLPVVSEDLSLVIFTEDENERWVEGQGTATTQSFIEANFNIGIARTDNSSVDLANSGNDRIFHSSSNDFISGMTPGGIRFIIHSQQSMAEPQRMYIATFKTIEVIDSETTVVDDNSTEIMFGGEMLSIPPDISLTDSAVQTTTMVVAQDAAGTMVVLPEDQLINFPPGTTTKSITIETPTEPTQVAELPDGAEVDAIPVKRTFGPAGTQFFPPIEITIMYTDAEVAGLDEESIRPYLFNDMTGKFDLPVPDEDIVARSFDDNTITFRVSHFSTYGLGAKNFVPPPQVPGVYGAGLAVLASLVLIAGAAWMRRERFIRH